MDFAKRRSGRILAKRQDDAAASDEWDIPGVSHRPSALDGGGSGDADIDAALASIADCAQAIRETCNDDSAALTDEATVRLLADVAGARRKLDAAYLSVVAVVDKRDAAKCAGVGVQSTQGLLKSVAGLTPGRAKSDVADARAIHGRAETAATTLVSAPDKGGQLAAMGDLLAEGEVSMAHIDTAVRTLDQVPERLLNHAIVRDESVQENETGAQDGGETRDGDTDEEKARDADANETDESRTSSVREVICRYFAQTAPSTSPGNLRQLGKHLINALEPDTDDHFDPESYARRSMTMSTDITGMVFGTFQLDPVAGAALKTVLDPLAAPRPVQTSDDGAVLIRDMRTPNQRRADALGDLAAATAPLVGADGRAGAAGPDGADNPDSADSADSDDSAGRAAGAAGAAGSEVLGGNGADSGGHGESTEGLFDLRVESAGDCGVNVEGTPSESTVEPSRAAKLRPGRRPARITVVSTAEKLVGTDPTSSHCFQTGDISQGTLARLACDATFERLVLDARGAVLDQGMAVRLATPAQKRAISARDKGCVFPGCDRPPSWCDAHHVQWHSRGGPTDVSNMCLLCEHHHTLVHTGSWLMRMIDGIPYAAPAERPVTAGGYAAIPDTAVVDGWVRNSYFDRLKETENLAEIIIRSTEHEAG